MSGSFLHPAARTLTVTEGRAATLPYLGIIGTRTGDTGTK